MVNGLLGLFQQQPDQLQSLLGQYYSPSQARMSWLGGTLQGIGSGIASGRPGAWAQGGILGGGEALDNYRQRAAVMYGIKQRADQQAAADAWRQKQWDYQVGRDKAADARLARQDARDNTEWGWKVDAHDNPPPDNEAPKVQQFFDEHGNPYMAQWNAQTHGWDKVGGSKAPPNGITITNPDGTTTQIGGAGGGAKMTSDQRRAKLLADQVAGQQDQLMAGFDALASPQNYAGSKVPGGAAVMTPEAQVAQDSLTNTIANWLYLTSGATATDAEIERQTAMVTPSPMDSPQRIAAKKARLKSIISAMQGYAGETPAAPKTEATPQIRTYNPNTGALE